MKISEIFPEVLMEDLEYEFKQVLSEENPIKWAKTIVAYANNGGGTIFVGVSNDGDAFGLTLNEIDKMKNLVARINDRNIFPHVRISYVIGSVDENAERYVLGIRVFFAESVVRYREGDFNETVYIRGDGNSYPARPEEIISLSKRRYGIDNETTEVFYSDSEWNDYLAMCRNYRNKRNWPSIKELQNEEILSKDEHVKSGFLMFKDDYDKDDTMVCCRLWKGLNKSDTLIDSARCKGNIPTVFENTLSFIEKNTKTGWKKLDNGGRMEIRSYPIKAIREALVNAIAHRDYSINGTQIDVDIYNDRLEIVSPGSWLLPKGYCEYPCGSIPSIRRNSIIAACLDVANLMERGGTGFQTMMEAYKDYSKELQPVVSIYPGFLNLKLFDTLYKRYDGNENDKNADKKEKLLYILEDSGSMRINDLQYELDYTNRTRFLKDIINPLIEEGEIYRDGNKKSPNAVIRIKED